MLNAEPDLEVIGEAGTTEEAQLLTAERKPDLVLMDISMPALGGIEATRRIKELFPEIQVLMLTMHEDVGLLREAIQAGAGGYIIKKAATTELIHAIRTLLRGDLYIHPSLGRSLLEGTFQKPLQHEDPQVTLTAREIDVLRLVAQGYTNNQIAEKLHISVRTVEYHRGNLLAKLHLESRVELVRYATQQHLI